MSNRKQFRSHSSMPQRRHLSNDKIHQILQAAQEDPRLQDLCDVVSIISLTGLRLKELENLLWADVDLANGRLGVPAPRSIFERYVPIGAKARQVLEARHGRGQASEYVFGTCPMAVLHKVRRQLAELGEQVGIGSLYLNDLRHTFFLNLMNSGASTESLMVIGGYSSRNLPMKFMSPDHSCAQAARDQARVEEVF